jgi:ankyrin repeat protein
VRLLLERDDINPNIADCNGRTPAVVGSKKLISANDGHEVIARQLLQHPDINPNSKLSNGMTPLMLATQRGYDNVVRLLPEDGDFDTRGEDSKYRLAAIDTAVGESSWRSKGAVEVVQGEHGNFRPASNSYVEKRAAPPSVERPSQLKKLQPS